jgi:PKD domain
MRNTICIFFCLLLTVNATATTRKVLFIGNSYTYTNSMPSMLQSFAAAQGDTLIFNQSDPGGYTLEEHSTYAPTISLIFSQPWDIVVLQEQSELPSFPPDQVDTQVYPYAHILDSMIHANDSCTQTMFMMTWGHADGDPANCSSYPVICSYDGMQGRLRESYMQMTQNNNAIVAPVGAAWKVVRDSFPALWLYQSDSIHPIITGSYLQTCVLYGSIFHRRASGCSYLGGVAASDAAVLQRIADKVTTDSLYQWQQYGHYPAAVFTASVSGTSASFADGDPISATHTWSFGDATTDTSLSPLHAYAGPGHYVVSHTVANACFSETQTDTISVTTTGAHIIQGLPASPLSIASGNGTVTITSLIAQAYSQLEVYAIDGRSIGTYPFSADKVVLHLPPGMYIFKAADPQGTAASGRFVTY